MFKNKLFKSMISFLCLQGAVAPISSLTSCGKGEKIKTEVNANPDWMLDFVYKTDTTSFKPTAYYRINIANFEEGETIKIYILKATDFQGQATDYFKIDGEPKLIAEKNYVEFNVGLKDDAYYNQTNDYLLTIQVVISKNNDTKTITLDDTFELTIANATVSEDFSYKDDTKKEITGWNGEEYKSRTLFVVPEGVKTIGDNAFFEKIDEEWQSTIPENMKYISLDPTWGEAEGADIEGIGNSAFKNAPFIGDCYIPSSVNRVCSYAFENVGFNKRFYIGNGIDEPELENVWAGAFSNCKFIGDCIIPEGTVRISKHAFQSCLFDGKLKLPKTLVTIDNQAFYNLPHLSQVEFPTEEAAVLNELGLSSFKGCGMKGDVYIPDSVKRIEGSVFENCKNIESLSLPGDLTYLVDISNPSPFKNLNRLTKLDLKRVRSKTDKILTKANLFVGCAKDVEKIIVILNEILEGQGVEQTLVSEGLPADKLEVIYQ